MVEGGTASINIRLACFEQTKDRDQWPMLLAGWLLRRQLEASTVKRLQAEASERRGARRQLPKTSVGLAQQTSFGSMSRGQATQQLGEDQPMAVEHFDHYLAAAKELLLEQCVPTLDQLGAVAEALNSDVQSLMYEDRLEGRQSWVLSENLKRLLGSKASEENLKALARKLEVSPSTISRWKKGTQAPDRATHQTLLSMFHLPANTDLRVSPIFLSYSPVVHSERVAWVGAQLEELAAAELHLLFPALRRLLS